MRERCITRSGATIADYMPCLGISMPLHRLDSLAGISAQEWDALVPVAQPFLRHAFTQQPDEARLGMEAQQIALRVMPQEKTALDQIG